MAAVPLILLAGPIVRRVEPRLAAVWVALNQPMAVRLVLYDGLRQAPVSAAPLAAGAANTLRVGNGLHLAVVVVELKAPATPLTGGRNYAYNLHFHDYVGASPGAAVLDPATLTGPSRDLHSLQLLKDGLIDGHPHLALGYAPNELPSFALPPPSLTDLRILHGSCRRPGFTYANEADGKTSYDTLSFVDDLVLKWRAEPGFDANRRPHQLFLTGDQIYADDVEGPMLPMLNRAGNRLLGRTEDLPTVYPPAADPATKQAYLGVPTPAGSASIEAFIAKHPLDAFDALQDDRVRARGRRSHAGAQVQDRSTTARTPSTRALHTGSPRLWPADLQQLPGQAPQDRPRVRDEVLHHRHRQSPDVVRRVLRDVPRGVVQRGLGAQATASRLAVDEVYTLPADAAAALGPARLLRRTSAIPRTDPARAREAAQGPEGAR